LPGDAAGAADDGAVGAGVGGEGGQAVVDALGVDGLRGLVCWRRHAQEEYRHGIVERVSWWDGLKLRLTGEIGLEAFAGFKWAMMGFSSLSAHQRAVLSDVHF
jgi:hypothetical protein